MYFKTWRENVFIFLLRSSVPCVCAFSLCAMTNHFCDIRKPLWYGPRVRSWRWHVSVLIYNRCATWSLAWLATPSARTRKSWKKDASPQATRHVSATISGERLHPATGRHRRVTAHLPVSVPASPVVAATVRSVRTSRGLFIHHEQT